MNNILENLYIGLDIGGTKCAAVIGNADGNIYERQVFDSGKDILPEIVMEKYFSIIDEFIKKYQIDGKKIKSIGISCGGPLDDEKGIIMSPPNLPLWDNIKITDLIKEKTGINAFIQNDANACSLAEWKFGAGKGTKNMIFLTFGTGMGAGLILDGKLYKGSNGMAGEVGHIRLSDDGPIGYNKKGSFEGYCSGNGIKHLAQIIISEKKSKNIEVSFCKTEEDFNNLTAKIIFEQAYKNDVVALEIVKECAKKLGKALSILIDILNPECIVLGSIYERGESLLRDTALEIIKEEALFESASICKIKPAKLGNEIGDYASLMVAIERER